MTNRYQQNRRPSTRTNLYVYSTCTIAEIVSTHFPGLQVNVNNVMQESINTVSRLVVNNSLIDMGKDNIGKGSQPFGLIKICHACEETHTM